MGTLIAAFSFSYWTMRFFRLNQFRICFTKQSVVQRWSWSFLIVLLWTSLNILEKVLEKHL